MSGLFPFLSGYVFPSIIFFIMMAMGLTLGLEDFRAIMKSPKAALVGFGAQMLVLPLLAFGFVFLLPVSPEMAVGLVALAASPGGVTSNAISLAVRADIALAVSLTALSTLFVAFTLPLWTGFAIRQFLGGEASISMPVGETMVTLGLLTILPVILGMLARARWPKLTDRIAPYGRRFSVLGIVFMCATTTGFNWQYLSDPAILAEAFGVSAALMFCSTAAAYVLSRAARLSEKQLLTVIIEVGVQNLAVAILAAVTIVHSPAMARLPLAYGLLMITLPWLFVRWVRRRAG
ncbi:bile acid:sodium symporter family protein [Gimibacter soli]|uniref:Bile acid:sodium symporter family protein n=1 Tax=Gimibacter soli TaxID=3024400 RepID=A0AAE9XLW3_9PROT|nr:bile acid:sodium symporter family protein [Gimibacter soli]WCL53322.1 bile acid:sodium symporter family protein [Gimibacter soli]